MLDPHRAMNGLAAVAVLLQGRGSREGSGWERPSRAQDGACTAGWGSTFSQPDVLLDVRAAPPSGVWGGRHFYPDLRSDHLMPSDLKAELSLYWDCCYRRGLSVSHLPEQPWVLAEPSPGVVRSPINYLWSEKSGLIL